MVADLVVAQQAQRGGTLHIAYEADITGMDPHTSLGIQALYVEQSLFNTLVTIDENAGYVPDLASSWEVKEERKMGRFTSFTWRKAHSIGFSGKRIVSYGEGRSTLDLPLIHEVQSQDQP